MPDNNVISHLCATERFGTQTRLAEAAGVKPHTICAAKGKNALPHDRMRKILQRAPEMGVTITPDDFFPEIASSSDRAA